MAKRGRAEGSEPFDVTLPEGFDLGEHEATLEAAAKQAGWTVERETRNPPDGILHLEYSARSNCQALIVADCRPDRRLATR